MRDLPLRGASVREVLPELQTLVLMPSGFFIFGRLEAWSKHTGKRKRME